MNVKNLKSLEVWFVAGSQMLYGEDTLKQVDDDLKIVTACLNDSQKMNVKIVCKPVLKTPDEIHAVCLAANSDSHCIGIIAWMHTFSPAQMWIPGLKVLAKPLMHFHTQFNRDIPWDKIDMDFMNLNQSAHGGREFGFINSRFKRGRKVVVGHWKDDSVLDEISTWINAALAWYDQQNLKIARLGDNMRDVAVTEGNKVSASLKFGYTVSGYGLGDLEESVSSQSESTIQGLLEEYENLYILQPELLKNGKKRRNLYDAARIEAGIRSFLEEGGFKAFTTTFENLKGLSQLPGIAVQRLMEQGYGFGAEGDWKTAALVRAMKVMSFGKEGGTSFMEDYTYHLDPEGMRVLGAHMLEVCPSVSAKQPSLEVHPLSIGGKDDPPRLVFDVSSGEAVNATVIDLGHRFRLLVNKVEVVPPKSLPELPVARALWKPLPDLKISAAAWILAGGAHHTGFSTAIGEDMLEDFAEIAGVEFVLIDNSTQIKNFKRELRWNEVYYYLNNGF